MKDKGGRPRLYDNAEALQREVDAYFDNEVKSPTITGLALWLGFESRQSIYDYEKEGDFSYTIKRARLRIEERYEQRLHGNSPAGAIFALKNFGWTDRQEIDHTTKGEKIGLDDEQLEAKLDKALKILDGQTGGSRGSD
jgi:hypothetical protein